MKKFLITILLILTLVVVVPAALAQDPEPTPEGIGGTELPIYDLEQPVIPGEIETGIEDWMTTLGLGGFSLVLVEILKRLGVVPDGQAGKWATTINVLLFAALAVAGTFGLDLQGDTFQNVAAVLQQLGKLAMAIMSSPMFHSMLRGASIVNPLPSRK